jgi:hypothetical protein
MFIYYLVINCIMINQHVCCPHFFYDTNLKVIMEPFVMEHEKSNIAIFNQTILIMSE